MILDALLQFDSGATVTATADSTNIIDLGVGRDMGIGDDPTLKVVCFTGANAWTTGTSLNIQVMMSSDGTNYYVAYESGLILLAQLTANTKIWEASLAHRPAKLSGATPRYIKLTYTVAGSNMGGPALITSYLTMDVQANTPYPSGIAIAN
jgi:hypothetical protein